MKVRSWPPSAPIVTDDLELRGFMAYDMQPFCESIDDDVCYWQGYEPPNIAQYRSLLQLVIRWPDRVPPVRPLALTCEGQFAGAYFLTPSIWWRDRWKDEGPHTLPNGRVVTARWYHHEQSY
jgi:hypothetical protein